MRILTVTTYFPNAADPQRAVFVKNLVRAMQRYCRAEVIAPVPYAPPAHARPAWRALRSIPARDSIDGIEIVHPRFLVLPGLEWFSGFGYFLGIFGALRRRRHGAEPLLVHAHCAYPDAVGVALAARLLRLPYVVTAHGSDINVYAQRPLLRCQIRWALRHAAGVIAVSAALQAEIAGLLGTATGKPACIPCAAFDPRVFAPRRPAPAAGPRARLLVFVGQLVPLKGLGFLIAAWAQLRRLGRTGASDQLLIIGDGPCRGDLERQAADAGLAASVRFAGPLEQVELARWIAAADLLCLPSLNEGTPNVIVEALACGVPVVASRVGGIPELVREGVNGLLVAPADSAALAQALGQALERDWDAQAIAASVADLSWQAIAERNWAFFQSIQAKRGMLRDACT